MCRVTLYLRLHWFYYKQSSTNKFCRCVHTLAAHVRTSAWGSFRGHRPPPRWRPSAAGPSRCPSRRPPGGTWGRRPASPSAGRRPRPAAPAPDTRGDGSAGAPPGWRSPPRSRLQHAAARRASGLANVAVITGIDLFRKLSAQSAYRRIPLNSNRISNQIGQWIQNWIDQLDQRLKKCKYYVLSKIIKVITHQFRLCISAGDRSQIGFCFVLCVHLFPYKQACIVYLSR